MSCADRRSHVLISFKRFSHQQQCSTWTAWWRRTAVCVTSGVMPEVRSTNPGKKQLFFHIRLQSIRFPVPPQLPDPGWGVFTESARPARSSLLGTRLVGGTAVHLGSDEGKWMSGVSSASTRPDEAVCLNVCAESPSPLQT